MTTTAESYLQALLALSGKPHLASARKNLLRGDSNRDLLELIVQGTGDLFPRNDLEELALKMLDMMTRHETTTAPNGGVTASPPIPMQKGQKLDAGHVEGEFNVNSLDRTESDLSSDLIDFSDTTSLTGTVERLAALALDGQQKNRHHEHDQTTLLDRSMNIPSTTQHEPLQRIISSSQIKIERLSPLQKFEVNEYDLSTDEGSRTTCSSAASKSKPPAPELVVPV
ncbi:hypothetical protein NX059_006561 [Plenodomus lindquistii]|nr:hypothetical protein NX059_006561 [Plenodomus lindquistii]